MSERGKITISDMERRFPQTSRRTLQRDMKRLVEQGICAESATSATSPMQGYTLCADFADRL
ncbi:MAG: winged helix-turn-helix transcriptional regulator [Thermoguttaceae bacterium]